MGAKDGNGNTAREAYYNRIGDKANHTPQPQYAHKDEDKPGYEGGNGQPFDAVLLDNTVDNNDKSTCRSPDLYGTPMIAVVRPTSGLTPLAIPKAMARGRATIPTMTPAIISLVKRSVVYPRKHLNS